MKLSDLSAEQQNDPHGLSSFFKENPTLLLDSETCYQLAQWLDEGHPAVKYALSDLIALTDPVEQCEYDAALPYFISNECNYQFEDIDESCFDDDDDISHLIQHLYDNGEKLLLGETENHAGSVNAIKYLNTPEKKLNSLLFHLSKNKQVFDKPQARKEAYEQTAIVKKYWLINSLRETKTPSMYRRLLEGFREIPPLPKVKKLLPIASQLLHSLSKAGVLRVDKGTQCHFNPSTGTRTEADNTIAGTTP